MWACLLPGEAGGKNITFHSLTTDNGLSQISVNSLYVDESGVIWIATREGLNRYDGNHITVFKQQKDNPYSLPDNTVIRLAGNGAGKMYLLCNTGVVEFDMATERFSLLLQGDISSVFYKGNLYISQKNEIYVWNEPTRSFNLFYQLPAVSTISCMYIDGEGDFWIGTTSQGLYRLDAGKKEPVHPITGGNIASLYQDSYRNIWVSCWESGLFCIRPDGSVLNLRHEPGNARSLPSDFVRSCVEDNEGNLWIGTFKGLACYSLVSSQVTDVFDASNSELTHGSVWTLVKDLQGTIWAGTYFGGVNYFQPEYDIYTVYKEVAEGSRGLSSPIVGRMTEDDRGNLWICTEGGGVNVYNRESRRFTWFRHKEGQNSLSQENVKAIYFDKGRQVMWIGTHLGGLNKLDLRTGHFTVYTSSADDEATLPSNIIRDIVPRGDSLVIGTQEGVCLFDPQTGKCRRMFKDSPIGRNIRMVADLQIDKDGKLWIAATGEGVYVYDFRTKELENYRYQPGAEQSLSSNNINNIFQDSQGRLWFCTSGSGLDLYLPQADGFENYDRAKNGLLSDCVYQVLESPARKGTLLLIYNQGFSEFDVGRNRVLNYNTGNGFPITAINENGLYVTHDGTVFLGGVSGLVSFREERLHFPSRPYKILLSRLLVNGKEVRTGDGSGILSRSLGYTRGITLQPDETMFSLEVATSNFIAANDDRLEYRLEGFSDSWTEVSPQKLITYTNLNPGNYRLQIRGGQAETVSLDIRILPPWYRTWWAYIIYVLVVSGTVWYLVRSYKSRVKLKESLKYEQKYVKDMEKLNQSKLRFFTNISHEFRTPLTLIIGQVETLLQVQNFTPRIYNQILGIYKSSIQLRELIGELLDFRKQEQGHMKLKAACHNIVNNLYEGYLLFSEYAGSRGIIFNFEKEVDGLDVWYDQKQMQKVVNNLLSNALKHTSSGDSITLRVSRREGNAVIEVRDTGKGIDKQAIERIFDRFYQADQMGSEGTGIGLALTKGIVEAHHGHISVESEVGKGSSFVISLPLGKEHFAAEELSEEREQDVVLAERPALLMEQEAEMLSESSLPEQKMENARILIVEDNESIKQMLVDIFGMFYRVTTASDGQEAWELVQQEMPDLILSDVLMPRMSGTELCKLVKSTFETCHIPVVLLTARVAVEHTLEGLRLGADDYITKPFNVNLLVSRCNNLVNSRRLLQEKFSKQPQTYAQILATNPMDKEMLDKAMDVIERHLDNTEFNVNLFAREMGMARTNLFTKLKAVTGQTPNDFILTIRLKKGAVLLKNNPELNVTEISEKIGFSSSRYFSKCFKDVYHVSPLAYRRGEQGGADSGEDGADEELNG